MILEDYDPDFVIADFERIRYVVVDRIEMDGDRPLSTTRWILVEGSEIKRSHGSQVRRLRCMLQDQTSGEVVHILIAQDAGGFLISGELWHDDCEPDYTQVFAGNNELLLSYEDEGEQTYVYLSEE